MPAQLLFSSRVAFLVLAAAVNVGLIRLVDAQFSKTLQPPPPSAVASIMSADFLVQSPEWDTSPFPEIDLHVIALDPNALQFVRFDTGDEDWLSGIIGSRSAPWPRRIQSVDIRSFAQRAGLRPGRPATVVLSIEVRADGTVRSAAVIRSCGDRRIDLIAADYAQRLTWNPGTVDKQPQAMRVVYPVTLVAPPLAVSRN